MSAATPLQVLRTALRIWSGKGARFLGAAVAFYALLSAAPLFVVVLAVLGRLFGRDRAESALWEGLGEWLTPDGVATVRELTMRVQDHAGSFAGVILVVYGSTRLFRALRRALNQLWSVDLEAVERNRPRVKRYALRYGIALALAVLVAVLVGALLIVKALFGLIASAGAVAPPFVLWATDAALSVVFAFVLFFALFKLLPEARVTVREAATSAMVSTGLFAAGSELVTVYVRHKHVGDLYEGASAVVLVVVWVYYSAQVFFLGASIGAALRNDASGVSSGA